MIKGMTGFGFSDISVAKTTATVELKSVNHRYLDISYYLPIGFASTENKIRDILQQSLERGKVTVSLKITNKASQSVRLNKETVRSYLKQLGELKKTFSLSGDISVTQLIQLPGVVEVRDSTVGPDTLWPAIEKAIRIALRGLLVMRESEGRSLAKDIGLQSKRMVSQLGKITKRAEVLLNSKRRGLTEEEFLSLQRNSDVNEEIARLLHHIEEIQGLLKSDTGVGKKIDFIAQEMQRETNTIGSKLQDKIVSRSVISLKSRIEKIREQSQNIE